MAPVLFRNVKVFDGTGAGLFDATVLVKDKRIAAVWPPGTPVPQEGDAVQVDGSGATLMPGLVEPHSHLCFTSAVDRITREWMPPPERHQFIAAHNAKVLLDHGFTSAFSGGATRPAVEVALRDEIAGGWQPGPRLKASSFERAVSGERMEFAPGVEAARGFAKDMIALGVDSMKMILDGRGALNASHWNDVNYGDAELEVVAGLAHEANVRLTCHAYTSETIRLAARHGFHCLYHCNFADTAAMDAIEARKDSIFVAPAVGILDADTFGSARSREEADAARRCLEGQTRVMPELHRRGVRVLPGGDYGFPHNPHGRNARDIALFVRYFGFTPAEALRAATQYGGQMMGMGDELGLIREGYIADLLLVDGDPLQDISLLQDKANLLAIMQEGGFYKSPPASRLA